VGKLRTFKRRRREDLQLVSDDSQRNDHAKTDDPAHYFRYERVEARQDKGRTEERRPDVTRAKDERWMTTFNFGTSTSVRIDRDFQYRSAGQDSL
jgi:hypothetical protein